VFTDPIIEFVGPAGVLVGTAFSADLGAVGVVHHFKVVGVEAESAIRLPFSAKAA